jgi:hypothetical protein
MENSFSDYLDLQTDIRTKLVTYAIFGFLVKSSQVTTVMTNNTFCIVQRATAQSTTENFRDYGVAEAPPGFQAGWSFLSVFFWLSLFFWGPCNNYRCHNSMVSRNGSTTKRLFGTTLNWSFRFLFF